MFERAAIIGIGLIGGSLARGLREQSLASKIIGYDASTENLARAHEIGVIDETASDLETVVAGADLIVISTPVGAAGDVLSQIGAAADKGALIIDVGSVKRAFAEAANDIKNAFVVPCHPIAGTERSGPDAGFAPLFHDRGCVLTPLDIPTPEYQEAVNKAAALWRALGSNVEIMDVAHHDLALAMTSHLPHLIAFTLVGATDDLESVTEAEVIKYSAGGFRDFTRIAASDPVMWRDVFIHNKQAVLEVLGRFTEELALLQRAIRWGDAETLEKTFARGRELRKAIVEAGQEKDVENFGRDT